MRKLWQVNLLWKEEEKVAPFQGERISRCAQIHNRVLLLSDFCLDHILRGGNGDFFTAGEDGGTGAVVVVPAEGEK